MIQFKCQNAFNYGKFDLFGILESCQFATSVEWTEVLNGLANNYLIDLHCTNLYIVHSAINMFNFSLFYLAKFLFYCFYFSFCQKF